MKQNRFFRNSSFALSISIFINLCVAFKSGFRMDLKLGLFSYDICTLSFVNADAIVFYHVFPNIVKENVNDASQAQQLDLSLFGNSNFEFGVWTSRRRFAINNSNNFLVIKLFISLIRRPSKICYYTGSAS